MKESGSWGGGMLISLRDQASGKGEKLQLPGKGLRIESETQKAEKGKGQGKPGQLSQDFLGTGEGQGYQPALRPFRSWGALAPGMWEMGRFGTQAHCGCSA